MLKKTRIQIISMFTLKYREKAIICTAVENEVPLTGGAMLLRSLYRVEDSEKAIRPMVLLPRGNEKGRELDDKDMKCYSYLY